MFRFTKKICPSKSASTLPEHSIIFQKHISQRNTSTIMLVNKVLLVCSNTENVMAVNTTGIKTNNAIAPG